MTGTAQRLMTVEEFVRWERGEPERHEYVGGIVRRMTGGTVDHARIKGNVYAALRAALRGGPCTAFVEGPRVVSEVSATYPDITVACCELRPKDDILRQPTVIFEVLSRSTQSYDRGEKWRGYQTIPSLTHCIFIAQDEPRVEIYARESRSWRYEVLDRADDALVLPALAVRIPLTEIYEATGVAPVLAAMVRDA